MHSSNDDENSIRDLQKYHATHEFHEFWIDTHTHKHTRALGSSIIKERIDCRRD